MLSDQKFVASSKGGTFNMTLSLFLMILDLAQWIILEIFCSHKNYHNTLLDRSTFPVVATNWYPGTSSIIDRYKKDMLKK